MIEYFKQICIVLLIIVSFNIKTMQLIPSVTNNDLYGPAFFSISCTADLNGNKPKKLGTHFFLYPEPSAVLNRSYIDRVGFLNYFYTILDHNIFTLRKAGILESIIENHNTQALTSLNTFLKDIDEHNDQYFTPSRIEWDFKKNLSTLKDERGLYYYPFVSSTFKMTVEIYKNDGNKNKFYWECIGIFQRNIAILKNEFRCNENTIQLYRKSITSYLNVWLANFDDACTRFSQTRAAKMCFVTKMKEKKKNQKNFSTEQDYKKVQQGGIEKKRKSKK